MNKSVKNKKEVRDIKAEAVKLAGSQKFEGQTKAQAKLIAQGIQRGIEQFLRQRSEQARNFDKRQKRLKKREDQLYVEQSSTADGRLNAANNIADEPSLSIKALLPWSLLMISWGMMAAYTFFFSFWV